MMDNDTPVNQRITLSVKEVSELTGRSVSSVWNDIKNQLFPVVRIGGRILILRTDLDNFLASNRILYQDKPKLCRGRAKAVGGER